MLMLLLTVTVVASGCTARVTPEEARAIVDIEELGGKVHLWQHSTGCSVDLGNTEATDAALVHLKRLTHLRYLSLRKSKVTDAGMIHVNGLTNLEMLVMDDTQVSDAGLVHLKELTRLHTLYLPARVTNNGLTHLRGLQLHFLLLAGSKVTDAGLIHLDGLSHLQSLFFVRCSDVSDEGLAQLGKWTRLVELSLYGSPITDAGLKHLAGLTNLRLLNLVNTKVSNEGVQRLQQALPNCQIMR
jgi:Leucine-rich repeat (LRR) protein